MICTGIEPLVTRTPTPIYRQMEKLEERKREAESQLVKLKASGVSRDEPVGIRDFEKFLVCLREIFDGNAAPKTRTRVIRALVKKVVITPRPRRKNQQVFCSNTCISGGR